MRKALEVLHFVSARPSTQAALFIIGDCAIAAREAPLCRIY